MHEDTKVKIKKRSERKYWSMYYHDQNAGRSVVRSTGETKKTEAVKVAAKWEAELQEGR